MFLFDEISRKKTVETERKALVMYPDIPIGLIASLIGCLLLASLGAIFFRSIRFPYSIGLVVVGILLGRLADHFEVLSVIHHFHLTPNIILYVLLPTLIFDAAVNIDGRLLLKNLTPVIGLAAPGLLIAMLITGGLVALLTPLGLGAAMVFGALISATDPVAVISLFKELGAPKRLTMLVDGESLFNDATSIVAFDIMRSLVVGGVLTGAVLFRASGQFVLVFAGGTLVGALIGYVMMIIIKLAKNDPLIQIALSTVIAYAAFILAQYYLNLSGVMAVVGAGLVIASYGLTHFTPAVKQYMHQFWEYASFVANSFIFLLLGMTEDFLDHGLGEWSHYLLIIGVSIAGILLARLVVVFGLVPILNRLPKAEHIDTKRQAVMFWGGLRGALPIGLAMSLPATFTNRTEIIEMTFGVVMFTLLIQGTTISKLIHILKLDRPSFSELLARAQALISIRKDAFRSVTTIEHAWPILPEHLIKKIENNYRDQIVAAEKELEELQKQESETSTSPKIVLWSQIMNVAREMYHIYFEKEFISLAVLREAEHSIDLALSEVRKGKKPQPFHPRLPLYYRCEQFLAQKAEGLLPHSKYVHTWNRSITRIEYERASALADVCLQIQKELPRLGELCGTDQPTIDLSHAFFTRRYDEAIDYLKELSEKYPKDMKLIQECAIHKVAFDTEQQTVEEILNTGGISPAIAAELIEDIKKQTKQMLYTNQHVDEGANT